MNGYVKKAECAYMRQSKALASERSNVEQSKYNGLVSNIQAMYYRAFFFKNESVTGKSFRRMLINYALPRFERHLYEYIFMQDGASPHYATRVRDYSNRKVPNNWIDRSGPVHCPARSPDLTPCDFFFGVILRLEYMRHKYILLKILNEE